MTLMVNPSWRRNYKPSSMVSRIGAAYGYWGDGSGEILPFQIRILNELFKQKQNGDWKYPVVGLNMPRQNGKTELVKARIIAGLFILHEDIFYTAHEGKMAHDMYTSVIAAITHYPELASQVSKGGSSSWGKESIVLSTGGTVNFASRKNDRNGMGGTKDCVIFDEAQELHSEYESMIIRVLKARPNAQRVYVGTPFLAQSEGDTFNGLIARAEEDDSVCVVRYGIDDENADVTDRALWKLTNPLYPDVIRESSFTEELATAMQSGEEGLRDFRVQDMGLWWKDKIPPAIPARLWHDSMRVLPNDRGTNVVALVYDSMTTTIGLATASYNSEVAGEEPVERHKYVIGDINYEASGTDSWQWIADKVGDMPRNTIILVDLGGLEKPIIDILPNRMAKNVVKLNNQEFLASQQGFLDLLVKGRFKHPDSPVAVGEVNNAQKVSSGNSWKFAPIRTEETIAGLKALSEAAWYRSVVHPKTITDTTGMY